MILMNALLIILAVTFFGSGMAFLNDDIWRHDEYMLRNVRTATLSLVIAFTILLILIATSGIYFAKNRSASNGAICCHALVSLFLVAIPLMVEGSVILELDKISGAELERVGNMNL